MVPTKVSWEDWRARSMKIRMLDTEELRKKGWLVLSSQGESRKHQRMWSSGLKGPQDFCRAKGIQVLVNESMEKEHGCVSSWKTSLLKGSVPNITMYQECRRVLLLAGRKRKRLAGCLVANVSEWDAIIPRMTEPPNHQGPQGNDWLFGSKQNQRTVMFQKLFSKKVSCHLTKERKSTKKGEMELC